MESLHPFCLLFVAYNKKMNLNITPYFFKVGCNEHWKGRRGGEGVGVGVCEKITVCREESHRNSRKWIISYAFLSKNSRAKEKWYLLCKHRVLIIMILLICPFSFLKRMFLGFRYFYCLWIYFIWELCYYIEGAVLVLLQKAHREALFKNWPFFIICDRNMSVVWHILVDTFNTLWQF